MHLPASIVIFSLLSLYLPREAHAALGAACAWGTACDDSGCQYCSGAKKGTWWLLRLNKQLGVCVFSPAYTCCVTFTGQSGVCDGAGSCALMGGFRTRNLQEGEECVPQTLSPTQAPPSLPPSTPSPTSPTTPSPATPSPATPAPTTSSPATPSPATPSPATPSPSAPSSATPAPVCPPGTDMCDDPHMKELRGQKIDWSGVDGGWYCMVKDDDFDLHVNVRLTAPLPEAFPDRQLITGVSIASEGHSLTIEVNNPYQIDTNGCPRGISPCLANGGLRAVVDGEEVDGLLQSSRDEFVADGITMSASNLPVECRQFGGDKLWSHMYEEMLQGNRQLVAEETFEGWILRFDHMAAPDWCTRFVAQRDLADVVSNHAIFKIMTSSVTVRLNVGSNYQGDGELYWDGRVLPNLEFWQMDVGLHGLSVESKSLSGILGETARPVVDKDGRAVMEGYDAFRGTVEDYRVSGSLGTHFVLLDKPAGYE